MGAYSLVADRSLPFSNDWTHELRQRTCYPPEALHESRRFVSGEPPAHRPNHRPRLPALAAVRPGCGGFRVGSAYRTHGRRLLRAAEVGAAFVAGHLPDGRRAADARRPPGQGVRAVAYVGGSTASGR